MKDYLKPSVLGEATRTTADGNHNGKHGHNWGDLWDKPMRHSPWLGDDNDNMVLNEQNTDPMMAQRESHHREEEFVLNSFGAPDSAAGNFAPETTKWNGKYWDASWELGDSPQHFSGVSIGSDTPHALGTVPDADAHQTIWSGYRWFEGIDSSLNGGPSEVDDPAKLKCHFCDEQRELAWNSATYVFELRIPGYTAEKNTEDIWNICMSALSQRSCEYSSGVCFVEERRTWGYITQVRAGCKQAQACYMQKYQNFLVQAGRQCWPGSNSGMSHKVNRNPYDVERDQWVHDIVKGGIDAGTNNAAGVESSFGFEGAFAGAKFDDSFVDNAGLNVDGTAGLYYEPSSFYNENFEIMHHPIEYQNGMKETSKCYQCCNVDHNCNYNWQPKTEADWNYAFVWKMNNLNEIEAPAGFSVPRLIDPAVTA
jgi:hypothetical protein